MEMAKATESLRAAELCYAQGFYNSSANRAYYAMFQAAQVALETAGFMRPEWSHMPACMQHLPMNSRDGASSLLLYLPVTSSLSRSCAILRTTAITASALDRLHAALSKAREGFVQAIPTGVETPYG